MINYFKIIIKLIVVAISLVTIINFSLYANTSLQEKINLAKVGSVIHLGDETYNETGIIINKAITIIGNGNTKIIGNKVGRIITVDAPNIVIKGLRISKSGQDLFKMDAAVFITKKGDNAIISNNHFEENLFSVYLYGPNDAIVENNNIIGLKYLRMNERGNGVQIWNSPGSRVSYNDISYGRDGIFTTTSKYNIFNNNRFTKLRFAIHYMYTNKSEVRNNFSTGNHIGYALMFSKKLIVNGNVSQNDRDHGVLLNYVNKSKFNNNQIQQVGDRCIFIYNSNKNEFNNNLFANCQTGIHFTAGSERNKIAGNAFINNRNQVKYVGTKTVIWSYDGVGNYWSDNSSFDLNGDNISDEPYFPNDIIDRIIWTIPQAKLLLSSPSVQILRWVQSIFPATRPGGVVDTSPLMKLPKIAKHLKFNNEQVKYEYK